MAPLRQRALARDLPIRARWLGSMDMPLPDAAIKRRIIAFQGPHWDEGQAMHASELLHKGRGILEATPLDPLHLVVRYDLRTINFREIEAALQEVGFHMDNSLLQKLRRALYEYTDDTQRANWGAGTTLCTDKCAEKVFVQAYRNRHHGCRDRRPGHWRAYL